MSLQDFPPITRHNSMPLGIPTSYHTLGQPEDAPLILLHGMSSSADSFRELMHTLAADYWLIAPDIPGFGHSGDMTPYTISHLVEWLAAFVAELDLQVATFVGHSFGGVVVTAFAHRYPEHVAGLILMAPALLAAARYPDWARQLVSPKVVEAVTSASMAVAKKTVLHYQVRAPFYDAASLPAHVFSRRTEDYMLARASGHVLSAVMTFDVLGILPNVEAATCLIWGEQDFVVPPRNAPFIAQAMPQVTGTLLLPECGHAPATEKTTVVANEMRTFMERGNV